MKIKSTKRILTILIGATLCAAQSFAAEPVDIGSRLQLLVDDHLIGKLSGGASLKLHRPQPKEIVIIFDKPWEGNTSIPLNIIPDGDTFRMYYRAENYAKLGGKTTHSSDFRRATWRSADRWSSRCP